MNKLIFIMFLLISCSSKHQNSGQTDGNEDFTVNKKSNDTIFISREKTKNNYCVAYIEKNRHSTRYANLLDFSLDSNETVEYKQNYSAIKRQHPIPYKIYDLSGLPKEWVPLYQYKNKFYIYAGPESGSEGRITVTDSTLNYWYMDGIYPEPFQSVEKLNKDCWCFKIHSNFENTDLKKITIHFDPFNKIAVWEDSSIKGSNRYRLYIPKETATHFDMVINFCSETKAAEFIFDTPDYKTLLKD